MGSFERKACLLVLVFALASSQTHVEAKIDKVSIKSDSRDLIVLERFGYTRTGLLQIQVNDVEWSVSEGVSLPANHLAFMGFFLATEDDLMEVRRELDQKLTECVLSSRIIQSLFTFIEFNGASKDKNASYNSPGANLYTLMFANCLSGVSVSMTVTTSMYNVEGGKKSYLSEGLTQLPTLYFCFFLTYAILEGIWIYICVKQKLTAHRIHILMGVLVLLKALYMFSEAEDMYYIKKTGTPHGWDVAFYAFSFLKGTMLFTVIILIGTGWSFLKPYLHGKEKKVLMIVIPLQVLSNIATVVVDETGLSSRDWLTWRQLFLLVDVICCCAVLFPIVWSIKQLREAAHTDGKAARNLAKLTLFRQYYVVVVSYIYFTRIVVFVLQTVTSYHYAWASELARELVTLAFYVLTGYKFRPVPHNPYFVLDDEEEAAAEEALRDDDFEL